MFPLPNILVQIGFLCGRRKLWKHFKYSTEIQSHRVGRIKSTNIQHVLEALVNTELKKQNKNLVHSLKTLAYSCGDKMFATFNSNITDTHNSKTYTLSFQKYDKDRKRRVWRMRRSLYIHGNMRVMYISRGNGKSARMYHRRWIFHWVFKDY